MTSLHMLGKTFEIKSVKSHKSFAAFLECVCVCLCCFEELYFVYNLLPGRGKSF